MGPIDDILTGESECPTNYEKLSAIFYGIEPTCTLNGKIKAGACQKDKHGYLIGLTNEGMDQ